MVEYKVTQLPSAYEEMRNAAKAEANLYNTITTGGAGSNLGITESAHRENIRQVGSIQQVTEAYAGNLFNISARFTGQFTGLSKILRKIRKNTNDLTSLFKMISTDFFSTNKEEVFSQHNAGEKPFFSLPEAHTRFGQYKLKTVGFLTPGLVFRGSLRESLTNPNDEFAVNIINPKSIRIGTKVVNFEDKPLVPLLIRMDEKAGRKPVRNPVIIGTRLPRWTQYAVNYLTSMKPGDFK